MKSGILMKSSLAALLGLSLASMNVYADNQFMSAGATDQAQTEALATKNKATGEAFLAANKAKPGVITLADGLQYKVIKEGKGVSPTDSDMVTVNYAGRLINGTEFDSSYKRGEPTSFRVTDVIPGWTEVLKLMKPGSTWEVYIPGDLAYGERGAPPTIEPNQTLIFKIELISVNK